MTHGVADETVPDDLNSIAGTLAISKGGTGETAKTPAFDGLSPNTTKGDIAAHNGTINVRLPVGAIDGQRLEVDSSEPTGMKWVSEFFGSNYEYAASEGESTTGSTIYINKLTLTTAVLPDGDYYVTFSAEVSQTNTTNATEVQFVVDSVVINEPRIEPKDSNNWYTIGGFAQVTLTGAIVMDIDFKATSANTAQIRRARVTIWRVA